MMKIDASMMVENPADAGDIAAALETAGFDGVYTFEGKHDPFLPLAASALKTNNLELITGIAVAFGRSPLTLAQTAYDLQLMSGGRFIMGLGSQVKAHIERRYSMPWSKPAARMRELVQAVRAIWHSWETGDKLNFSGEFYQHTLMIPSFNPGPNPHGQAKIFIAGVGPLMTEVAAEVGDGYFVHPFHTLGFLRDSSLPALQRGFAKADKTAEDFQISCQVIVATGFNDEEIAKAREGARNQIAFYSSTPGYIPVLQSVDRADIQPQLTKLSKQGDWSAMASHIDDELVDAVAVTGSPKEVAEKIMATRGGLVDRISPVIYGADSKILKAVLDELKKL